MATDTELITYDTARRMFWDIMMARTLEIEAITGKPFSWQITPEMRNLLQNLIRYFIGDQTGEYPLHKGLFIYGKWGTGKTEIMQALQTLCRCENLESSFEWTSMSQTYVAAKTDKDFDPIAENVTMNRCLDEFGRYTGSVLRYGDPIDINEAIVEERYRRFQRYGQKTFFISNAAPNDLKDVLSGMIIDRITAMATSVYFPGESKRK